MFVGKDFLSRKPPPNYKPGVGRGAVGFSTTAERGGLHNGGANAVPGFPRKRASTSAGDKETHAVDPQRFVDPDEEADAIYAAVEKRRQRKKRQLVGPTQPLDSTHVIPKMNKNQQVLSQVSIDEWAHIPEAMDTTKTHKRIREQEQQLKRTYTVDSRVLDQLSSTSSAHDQDMDLRKRESLQLMVRKQPHNAAGYIQLALLEENLLRVSTARKIAARGCIKIPESEQLWLLNIRLHSTTAEGSSTGAESREIAIRAVKALPNSEPLWLELISLEPAKAYKLKRVHDALSQPRLMKSEALWILAAEFEVEKDTKVEVLETALQMVDTPSLWLKLAEAVNSAGSHDMQSSPQREVLARARKSHPTNEELWIQSVKCDDSLAEAAVEALSREVWLNILKTSDLGSLILPFLKPTSHEFAALLPNKSNWGYMAHSEAICNTLLMENSSLFDEALRLYPHSELIWNTFLRLNSAQRLEEYITHEKVSPPANISRRIAMALPPGDLKSEWLDQHKNQDPHLWELYISEHSGSQAQLVEEGLAQWPEFAPFYACKARLIPDRDEAKHFLRSHFSAVDDSTTLWLTLAELETSAVRRRAILTQATTAVPQSPALWLARVDLERQHQRPVEHLISEGLEHNPGNGLLWVEELKQTPANGKKKRLADAMKASKMSCEVLLYGARYFESINMLDKAQQWNSMAAKSGDTDK